MELSPRYTPAEIEQLTTDALTVWIAGGGHVEHHPELRDGLRLVGTGEASKEVAS